MNTKSLLAAVGCMCMLFLNASISLGAPVLSLVPSGKTVSDQDFSEVVDTSAVSSIDIDIYFSLPEAEYPGEDGLYGAAFIVDFNPNFVTPLSAAYNTLLFSASEGSKVIIGSNNITFGLVDAYDLSGPYGVFQVGTMSFQLLAPPFGPGEVALFSTRDFSASDYDFVTWLSTSLDDDVAFKGGELSAVPIPSTLLLLGGGLAGILGLKRRKRS